MSEKTDALKRTIKDLKVMIDRFRIQVESFHGSPQERVAFEKEINRLQKQYEMLKETLDQAGETAEEKLEALVSNAREKIEEAEKKMK